MYRILALIAAVAAVAAYAGQDCDFDRTIRGFEKVVEHARWMKGAEEKRIPVDPDDPKRESQVERKSKPVTSGIYSGKLLVDTYIFYGCTLKEVWMDKVDPESLDTVANSVAFIRENGKLGAICPDGHPVYRADPFRFEPNMDCECFDENGMPKKKGKFGCMTRTEFLVKKQEFEARVNKMLLQK